MPFASLQRGDECSPRPSLLTALTRPHAARLAQGTASALGMYGLIVGLIITTNTSVDCGDPKQGRMLEALEDVFEDITM